MSGRRYGLVLLAYPSDHRRRHGDELAATADELAGGHWSFRQARSLLIGGLRARALESSGGEARQLWADGVGLTLVLWFLLQATPPFVQLVVGADGRRLDGLPLLVAVAVALVPVAALVVTTRWPACLAVVTSGGIWLFAVATAEPSLPFGRDPAIAAAGQLLATTALAWWLGRCGDGRRAMSPTGAIAILVVLVGVSSLAGSPFGVPAFAAVIFGLPLLGLALVLVDPRWLMAATALWATLVVGMMPFRLAVGGGGLDTATVLFGAVTALGVGVGLALARFGTRRLVESPSGGWPTGSV